MPRRAISPQVQTPAEYDTVAASSGEAIVLGSRPPNRQALSAPAPRARFPPLLKTYPSNYPTASHRQKPIRSPPLPFRRRRAAACPRLLALAGVAPACSRALCGTLTVPQRWVSGLAANACPCTRPPCSAGARPAARLVFVPLAATSLPGGMKRDTPAAARDALLRCWVLVGCGCDVVMGAVDGSSRRRWSSTAQPQQATAAAVVPHRGLATADDDGCCGRWDTSPVAKNSGSSPYGDYGRDCGRYVWQRWRMR